LAIVVNEKTKIDKQFLKAEAKSGRGESIHCKGRKSNVNTQAVKIAV
jgi:hypothetical protein